MGSAIFAGNKIRLKVNHRGNEGMKMVGGLRTLWRNSELSIEAKE